MYSTVKQITDLINEEKVLRLLDLKEKPANLQERLRAFIDSADRTINTRLGPMYFVPITDPQALIILDQISHKIAYYEMYALNEDGNIPEKVKDGNTWAHKELDAYCGSEINGGKPYKFFRGAQRHQSFRVKNLDSGESISG